LGSKEKITEQPSHFDHLEQMSVGELLRHINEEDRGVAEAVGRAIPQIEALVTAIEKRMKQGGRLFYIGAGTSGRLGVLDASELPPTFGVPANKVMGIIAGGDKALRKAVVGKTCRRTSLPRTTRCWVLRPRGRRPMWWVPSVRPVRTDC
jgi:N-acetylmuramic acid 6-phosphate etherase